VAREIKRLADEGCRVQVIVRVDPPQHSPSKKVRQYLASHLLVLPYRGKLPAEQSVNSIHTKIILIDASIDNSAAKVPVVLTGSHNLDPFSLRANDETLLEIRDRDVFNSYMGFLDRLVSDFRASGLPSF
jgi:phosphatidylserine/phosphatidylglycerophosphate/cardiolipin synthase-like enzyme